MIPPVILAVSYAFRAERRPGRLVERIGTEPLLTGGMTLLALVPWFVASWQSSRTFLYPLVLGTFHR